jgi:hypothetical protein
MSVMSNDFFVDDRGSTLPFPFSSSKTEKGKKAIEASPETQTEADQQEKDDGRNDTNNNTRNCTI